MVKGMLFWWRMRARQRPAGPLPMMAILGLISMINGTETGIGMGRVKCCTAYLYFVRTRVIDRSVDQGLWIDV